MKRQPVLLAVFVLILAFAIVAIKQSTGDTTATGIGEIAPATTDTRAVVIRFWQIYRTATTHRMAGRYRAAAESYAAALELNNDHEDALYYLGNMQLAIGNPAAALAAWRRLVEVNSASSRGHLQLGKLHFCTEYSELYDLDSAAAYFNHAWNLNREETGSLTWLAEVAIVRNDAAAADSLLRAATTSNPRNIGAHLLLGYINWESGDQRAAREDLSLALADVGDEAPPASASREGDTREGGAMVLDPPACPGLVSEVAVLVVDRHRSVSDAPEVFQAVGALVARARRITDDG